MYVCVYYVCIYIYTHIIISISYITVCLTEWGFPVGKGLGEDT